MTFQDIMDMPENDEKEQMSEDLMFDFEKVRKNELTTEKLRLLCKEFDLERLLFWLRYKK